MKKSLLYLVLLLSVISCTNYYTVLLQEDTPLYSSSNSETSTTVIPKGTEVYLSSKPNRKNYRKIKWGNYYGWANKPQYSTYSNYTSTSSYTSPTVSSVSSYNTGSSSGGSVSVKGYTRKDGTYVRPHTRSAPRRR
jgi:CRISPR/Cas system-associated endonuclease/helicase Cas3